MPTDEEKIAELNAIVHAVRERVRRNYPQPGDNGTAHQAVHARVADLLPILHARDAAQAKVAAIGGVNPRAAGFANKLIQLFKKTMARALGWFVRDQVVFNRESVACVEAILEALNEHNQTLVALASETSAAIQAMQSRHTEEFAALSDSANALRTEARELQDIRKHWAEWRLGWEQKLATNEIQFLRSVADLQGAFQHRSTLMESGFRDIVKSQHADYLGALDRANLDIQQRLWADLDKIKESYERLIHNELRFIRQQAPVRRMFEPAEAVQSAPVSPLGFDYARFAERFRGGEDYVRRCQDFYRPFFAGQENVLDIGCGRGEMLETLGDAGVTARGIDLSDESALQCRAKGLQAEAADLFEYLAKQPDNEFGGIVSSQVVEHLQPERLPEMIRLCAAKMRRGAVLAIETPNPECLAIFATHFYLDPTHTRPVPNQLLAFYMEEAGFGRIEVHRLSPAEESFPEIKELPAEFRQRFFGGLDYAIIARKL